MDNLVNTKAFGFADDPPPESITTYFINLFKVGEEFAKSGFSQLSTPHEYCEEAYETSHNEEWFKKKLGKDIKKDCARNFSLSVGTGVPVISLQLPGDFGRNYVVSSWPYFLTKYFRKSLNSRCFYENIYKTDPCRLYVDIETSKTSEGNMLDEKGLPTENYKRREKMVLRFARALSIAIDYFYSKEGIYASKFFVIDSSSKDRFSQHLIFHLNEDAVRFKSSEDLQALFEFILRCCTFNMFSLKKEGKTTAACTEILDGEGNPFFWPERLPSVDGSGNPTEEEIKYIYMVDMTVYGNKSREFRIAGSTKNGQSRFMTPRFMFKRDPCEKFGLCVFLKQALGHLKSYPGDIYDITPLYDSKLDDADIRAYFYDMLVCFIPKSPIRRSNGIDFGLTFFLKKKEFKKVEANLKDKKKASPSSFSVKEKRSLEEEYEITEAALLADMKLTYQTLPESLKVRLKEYEEGIEVKRDHIFELVAEDIIRQNPTGLDDESLDAVGFVNKKWFYHVSFKTGSRYCNIKGDEHSSNHVYYVAELRSKRFYQRCWNLNCCEKRKALYSSKTSNNGTNESDQSVSKKQSDEEKEENNASDNDDDEDSSEDKVQRIFGESTKNRTKSCRSDLQLISMTLWGEINDFLKYESDFKTDCKAFLTGSFKEPENPICFDDKGEDTRNKAQKRKRSEEKEKEIKKEDSDDELLRFLF